MVAYNIIFGDKSSKLNVEKEKITIESIVENEFKDYIAVIGTVEPITTVYLDAIEGGRVEEIIIDEGNMVKKGDVILLSPACASFDLFKNYEERGERFKKAFFALKEKMDGHQITML